MGRDGIEPRGAVIGHGARQRLHVQAETPVAGNHAYALRSNANDHRRPDLRAMALVAHVNGRPRRDKGVEAGRRAAARQKSARAVGIAEPAPQPVNNDQLELAGAAGCQPGALVDVVPGGNEVGQHPRPSGRRRDEPEETGVIVAHRERQDLACGLLHDLRCRPASGGSSISWSTRPCLNSPSQAFSPGRLSIRSTRSSAALRARSSMSSGAIRRPSTPSSFVPELGSLAPCAGASDGSRFPFDRPDSTLLFLSGLPKFPYLFRSCQAHTKLPILARCPFALNRGPFPGPALPGFVRTAGLYATRSGPAKLQTTTPARLLVQDPQQRMAEMHARHVTTTTFELH